MLGNIKMEEVFGLEVCAEAFKEIAERINLYSLTRGINRFPGMLLTFEELRDAGHHDVGAVIEEMTKYIGSGNALSNAGLEAWLRENQSEAGDKILKWSKLGDQYFDRGDMDHFEEGYNAILKAAKSGEISEEVLNASVLRILKAKVSIGLFENRYADPKKANASVGTKEHQELLFKLAMQKMCRRL